MKQLLKSRKELILLVAVLFAHLVLLSAQATQAQTTPLLRSWSMQVAAPVLKHFVGSLATLSRIWYGYIDLRNAREENRFIKTQLAESRQTLILYEEKIKELARLQVLNELEANLQVPSVRARIIGGDSTQWYNSRIIDQGLDAGITKDCATLTPDGVIGRVVYVSKKSAIIQLITDSDSGVGVLLENSRAQGVLKGTGKKEAFIAYIGTNEKLTVGEKVLTSGLDQIYPKGLLVGYVKSAAPTKGIFQKIEVTIAVNVQKLEEVLVLKQRESVS
jgi:rod shape-determining protein MreC